MDYIGYIRKLNARLFILDEINYVLNNLFY
jgi:hypothetical protein